MWLLLVGCTISCSGFYSRLVMVDPWGEMKDKCWRSVRIYKTWQKWRSPKLWVNRKEIGTYWCSHLLSELEVWGSEGASHLLTGLNIRKPRWQICPRLRLWRWWFAWWRSKSLINESFTNFAIAWCVRKRPSRSLSMMLILVTGYVE